MCDADNDDDEMDPFAVFGDDQDDALVDEAPPEASRVGRYLVEKANQSSSCSTGKDTECDNNNSDDVTSSSEALRSATDDAEKFSDNLDPSKALSIPSWRAPLYIGPMILVSGLSAFGGGRGYVAFKDLSPGTLLLAEEPILSWLMRGEVEFVMEMVLALLTSADAPRILLELEEFHPTKSTVVDSRRCNLDGDFGLAQIAELIKSLHDDAAADGSLQACLKLAQARGLTTSDGSPLSEDDCHRLVLALRFNSLESGIYLHAAMLNHADQPNCVKFFPNDNKTFSEVRTTRPVRAGEPLTISYLPRILSHASRRKHLFEQHRFDIGDARTLDAALQKMEVVDGELPVSENSNLEEGNCTHRVESALADLRDLFQDAEAGSLAAEYVKGLEQASLELYNEAMAQLRNDHHLLLIPCLGLHLDCCDLVMRVTSLSGNQRTSLLCRTVESARKLVVLQETFHGPDHFDLARSYLDLVHAIDEILSRSPTQLLKPQVEGLGTTTAWSLLANKARKEHNRIKALYPHDTERWIRAFTAEQS